MHVHGHQPSVSSTALAGAHAAESAAALKRARELREAASRLKASLEGGGLEAELGPDAVAMIGCWSQGASSDGNAGDRRRASPDAVEEGKAGAAAVSYWA